MTNLHQPRSTSRSSIRASKSTSFIDPDFHRGSSTFTYPNGDKYEGQYCAHISGLLWKEGSGTYYCQDGQSYQGKWYDDRLVEGDVVKITFKDKSVYEGLLEKYKFKGSACLTVPGDLKLILEFVENKPVGDVILLDNVGRPWFGKSEGDQSILYQENIYFENIPASRGKALSRFKRISKSRKISTQLEKEAVDMAKMEKRVFKESNKLKRDFDFEHSEWYRNYINFKKKQQIIMGKVKRGLRSQLNDEEFEWYIKYEEFKERYNKLMLKRKLKPNDPVDLSLLHTFYSEEYQASKPDFVIYPTKKKDM
ncbi:hypothetical protein HHI36_014242 [Cryptolaemus montrouzieri]|uniref:Uncharacterized protein n=1 Tax=Cryptolaemus montrouzieri TaxID=559131 RepID=A0ABD2N2R7_9CUCU